MSKGHRFSFFAVPDQGASVTNVQEHFDKKADRYYEHVYLSGKKNCHVHNQQIRRKYFRKLILDYLNNHPETGDQTKFALDIGSGPGPIAQILMECGCSTHSIDISFQMLLNNQEQTGTVAKLAQCSAASLSYKDNYFDIVTAAGVLEYIPEDEKVLQEVFRVLKPGGMLIISVPISEWVVFSRLRKQLGRLLFKREVNRFYHKGYTPRGFRKAVAKAGFDLRKSISHHFVFFPFDYLFPELSIKLDLFFTRLFERNVWLARFGKTLIIKAAKPDRVNLEHRA